MLILAKAGTYYVLKAPLDVAEEISHLQASGAASFSLALRPDIDTRQVDASALGTTTNRVIIRYGLRSRSRSRRCPARCRRRGRRRSRQRRLPPGRARHRTPRRLLGQFVLGHVADPDATSDPISRR